MFIFIFKFAYSYLTHIIHSQKTHLDMISAYHLLIASLSLSFFAPVISSSTLSNNSSTMRGPIVQQPEVTLTEDTTASLTCQIIRCHIAVPFYYLAVIVCMFMAMMQLAKRVHITTVHNCNFTWKERYTKYKSEALKEGREESKSYSMGV